MRLNPAQQHYQRLILGVAGSGRNTVLTGMFGTAILNGQDGLYVDGSGDTRAFSTIMKQALEAGRQDDVLVINFTNKQTPKDSSMRTPWLAGDVDWNQAIGNHSLIVVLLPSMEKASSEDYATANIITHHISDTINQRAVISKGTPPQAIWVFNHAGGYLNDACVNIATKAGERGVITVWSDQESSFMKQEEMYHWAQPLYPLCELKIFMKGLAEDEPFLESAVKDKEKNNVFLPTRETVNLKAFDAVILLDDTIMRAQIVSNRPHKSNATNPP